MKIPTFQEAETACERGNPTALDTFVQSWEPAGNEDEAEFREQLQKVVDQITFKQRLHITTEEFTKSLLVPHSWRLELIGLLMASRPNHGDIGSRDVDVTARRRWIDDAILMIQNGPMIDAPQATNHYREALITIARTKNLTATPDQLVRALRWMAADAAGIERPKIGVGE